MRKFTLLITILILSFNSSFAQKRYAILFGCEENNGSATPFLYYSGEKEIDQQEAAWNDTYLMWELLINNGYNNEDITVLYQYGDDYVREHENILDNRYDPREEHGDIIDPQYGQITDMSATKQNLQNAIASISNSITEDDYLVFLVITHGHENYFQCNNYDSNNPDTYVTATNISDWLAPIYCKKIILMQQCKGGSFIDELNGNNTIIMTATNDSCLAGVADEKYYYFDPISGEFDYDTEYIAEDEFEEYKTSHEHIHSEWFLHLYSAMNGKMPDGNTKYETSYANFLLSDADINSDNFITLNEVYQRPCMFNSLQEIWWNPIYHNYIGDDPQLSDNGSASTTTIAFTDIITSNITSNKTYKGIIGINKDIHVTSGNTLTLGSKARLEFIDNAKLIVDAGATLVLNEATIVGNNSNNKIQVYGTLQASNNTIFKTEDENSWGGLVLNSNSTVSINNCSFQNVDLTGYANSLTVNNNCEFNNSYLAFTKGDLTVLNSNFTNTQLRATSPYSSSEVVIDNCEISNYNFSAIYINGYNKYSIEDCSIHDNGYNGIYVYNAGSTSGTIKNNSITSNGTNNHAGIRIYNSYADIELNEISDNRYGVMCLNGSNTSIKGYQFANYPYETQQIVNNEINQIYTSSLSFPDYLRYNKISDSYNPYYKVYYDGTPSATLDVRYNNWGRFNTSEDLYPNPSDYYEYFPLWFFTIPQSRISMAEKTYNEGLQEKNNKNYDHAEKNFKKVIEKYSDSPFAIHSLKELMAVESLNKENYKALKEYLLTEKKIQQDKLLEKLAGRLANRCDIKLKNYRQAIEWFEKVIENSETLEDSVFAIIDLAETYFLMQNDKNSFVGKRAEFKFESFPKFEMKREELIDLLMAQKSKTQTINQETTENKNEKETENTITPIAQQVDFKVFPNPIKDEAHFQYQLNRSAQVCIKMFDYSGKEIAIVENSYHEKGFYEKVLNTQNIKPDIYFYSFELNGKTIQTKKIIITN